jgi:hypothetical protein
MPQPDTINVDTIRTQRAVLSIYTQQYEIIAMMAARFRGMEATWVAMETQRLELYEHLDFKSAKKIARAAAIPQRPAKWPGIDGVVERLLRQRLAEADVADLQDELLNPDDEAALRLPGRRPGTPDAGYQVKLAVTLPVSIVAGARRAAWRLSGGTLVELRELFERYKDDEAGLSYRQYRKARAGLAAQVITWADLARQAINRYAH